MSRPASRRTNKNCYRLDTKWFKDHGYFSGRRSGSISWNSVWGKKASISFSINLIADPHIRFQYTINGGTPEEEYISYRLSLIQIKCNLKGFRWAFQCTCGRKAYVLYMGQSPHFRCLHCTSFLYESQKLSGSAFAFLGKLLDLEKKYIEIRASIYKWHYKGKQTKKVQKMLKLKRFVQSHL